MFFKRDKISFFALLSVAVLIAVLFDASGAWASNGTNPATFTYNPGGIGTWNSETRWTPTYYPFDVSNTSNAWPDGVSVDSGDIVDANIVFSGTGKVSDFRFRYVKPGTYTITATGDGTTSFDIMAPETETTMFGTNASVRSKRTVPGDDKSPVEITIVVKSTPVEPVVETFGVKFAGKLSSRKLTVSIDTPEDADGFKNEDMTNKTPKSIPAAEAQNFAIGNTNGWKIQSASRNPDGSKTVAMLFSLVHVNDLTRICVTGYGFDSQLLKAERVPNHGVMSISPASINKTFFKIVARTGNDDAAIQGVWYREDGDEPGTARKIPVSRPVLVKNMVGYAEPQDNTNGTTNGNGGGGCNGGLGAFGMIVSVALFGITGIGKRKTK